MDKKRERERWEDKIEADRGLLFHQGHVVPTRGHNRTPTSEKGTRKHAEMISAAVHLTPELGVQMKNQCYLYS